MDDGGDLDGGSSDVGASVNMGCCFGGAVCFLL